LRISTPFGGTVSPVTPARASAALLAMDTTGGLFQ